MNNVILTGNLTSDSELNYSQTGTAVCKNCIAVSDGFGERKQTYFINLVLFQKLAESFAQHSFKGQKIGVVGKLVVRTYEASDGKRKSVTEVHVASVDYFQFNDKQQSESAPFKTNSIDIEDLGLPF